MDRDQQSESLGDYHESHDYPTKLTDMASSVSEDSSEIRIPLIISQRTQEEKKGVSSLLEYVSSLAHLAVFGVLGVLTRHVLQKLFGPGMANVTSDHSILYFDLPSNMVGSFLMGWFGIVFKADISRASDQLSLGLSTGYLGSLTTFSGWNQKMLELSINGHWVLAVLGFVIGFFLSAYSIILGVETAKGFKWLLSRGGKGSSTEEGSVKSSTHSHLIILLVLLLTWGGLWITSGALFVKEFKDRESSAQLWLACLVGPFGVWIRSWLGLLNGRGLSKEGLFEWIPFGTLTANVSAACIMAALATMKKAVTTYNCDTIASGMQFGLMGCLSTVSTMMAEFYAMTHSKQPWKGYAYVITTVGVSFGLGTLICSVPLWTK
uniref:Fluoride ion transporter CrcB n=1 Tax=Opuntia streptacantha TaxID=393608 RepID=A0A7C9D132_OPUST